MDRLYKEAKLDWLGGLMDKGKQMSEDTGETSAAARMAGFTPVSEELFWAAKAYENEIVLSPGIEDQITPLEQIFDQEAQEKKDVEKYILHATVSALMLKFAIAYIDAKAVSKQAAINVLDEAAREIIETVLEG